MGKAYIVLWVNMTTLKVEKAGVYSEASPTQHTRETIPLVYAQFSGEDFGSAADPARRALDALHTQFPALPVGDWETAPPERDTPTFYCGRCKQHLPHYCPAPSAG